MLYRVFLQNRWDSLDSIFRIVSRNYQLRIFYGKLHIILNTIKRFSYYATHEEDKILRDKEWNKK